MSVYSDLTNLADILKNVYGSGLKNQFGDEKMTYNQFPKSDKRPSGNGYIFGVRYARTQSVGGRLESIALPQAFTGKKDQGKIQPRYIYGTLRLTGPAIEIAKGDTAAFVDSLADEMDDIYQAVVVDMNRQSHGDGFGQLGVTSAAATPSSSATWDAVFNTRQKVQYFQEGMLVDFFNSTGATADTTCVGQRVSSITPSTYTVSFEDYDTNNYLTLHPDTTIAGYTNTAASVPVSSIAVKMGAREAAWASTDTPNEITGLEGIYDDGTLLASFENITVATYPKWAANIVSNSSVDRELTIDLMLNAVDIARQIGGKGVDTIRMGLGQRRKYANLLLPDVRFAPTVLKGGYETLSFSGGDGSLNIVVDPLTQPGKIYMEPNGVIKKYELTPLGWGNLDGSQMHRRAGYDEWDLFLRLYTNLGCEERNSLVKISDLVEPDLF